MPLKIQLNGQTQQLTGPGRPLVVFANGQKYVSTKGITFINGVKKVLWSANDLRIDYIPNIYNVCGTTMLNAVWASNNKIILSSNQTNGYGIWRVNVENKSAPALESNVDLGRITCFSPVDSTASNMVYYAVAGTQKAQQININPITAEITASNVVNFSSTNWGNFTGGLLGTNIWLGRTPGKSGAVYANTTRIGYIYSIGTGIAGAPVPLFAKRDETSYLACKYTNLSTGGVISALCVVTATEIIERVQDVVYEQILVDTENNNNIVCAGRDGFAIYTQNFDNIVSVASTSSYRSYYLLGRIRDYYYVVSSPRSRNESDQNVYLYVYDLNGTLFTQQILNLQTQFVASNSYDLIRNVPNISQTGALAFVFYPSSSNGYDAQTQLVLVQGY